jgi:hypothetical protein
VIGAKHRVASTPAGARPSGPFETYRRIFERVFSALSAAQPDARDRLNS